MSAETQIPIRLENPIPPRKKTGARVYVACLAAYNDGSLHGAWIAADRGEQHLWQQTREMLNNSPAPNAEEWAIHDHDGFEGAPLSEHLGFAAICELAEFICERGALGGKLCEYYCGDTQQARAAFEDYAGCYASLADFAETLTRETGPEIPNAFQYYIDWPAMGQDMALNGDVFTIEMHFDEVHVFWCR